MDFGKTSSVLYPLKGPNPVQINNRDLDGFIERFKTEGCQHTDCQSCGYCQEWSDRIVKVDPEWKSRMQPIYDDLLGEIDSGKFWDPYVKTVGEMARKVVA